MRAAAVVVLATSVAASSSVAQVVTEEPPRSIILPNYDMVQIGQYEAIESGAAGIHGKQVSRTPVEKRSQYDGHMIFGLEIRVAADAEADDARWIGIFADDPDNDRFRAGEDADDRARGRRRTL